jgi:ketol-acid reductoisomerase
MQKILEDIQSGWFARRWIEENQQGRPRFTAVRQVESGHAIEAVGEKLRAMMPFLDPVTIKPGE